MKLSIATLLSIPALAPAVPAFAEVLGEDYRNPDFQLTQANADAVAAWLDARHTEIPHIGQEDIFGVLQDADSYMDNCRSSEKACFAAKEVFRVAGLSIPDVWSEAVS